jgi:hypothetical protein
MATAINTPRAHAGELKLEAGIPQVFALKFLEPKGFEGSFGMRGMYTVADEGYGERKIWMDWEAASNLAIELRRLKIQKGEPIQVMKVKHERGGGTGYLVSRPTQTAPAQDVPEWVTRTEAPTPTEAMLAQSVAMVRQHGPQVFRATPETREVRAIMPDAGISHEALAPGAEGIAAALKAAIDASLEATVYAARKGLELAFSEESIRALAATVYIQNAKGGR